MPVPGHSGVCQVYMMTGVRVFRGKPFYLFKLILPDSDFHSSSYMDIINTNMTILLYKYEI